MMTSADRGYKEKRNYIRMKIDAPAAITITTEGINLEGTCRDLSGGGMMIEIAETLPVGTQIEVLIASAHGHSPVLKARAEVTRVISQPDKKEKPCLLGMEIIEVLN